MNRSTTRLALPVAVLLVAWLATGCFNPFGPRLAPPGATAAPSEPAPRPTSPQNALKLLQWCWVNLRIAEYEELFTDDFEFAYSDVEAVDEPPLKRDEEIQIARRMFVDGTASEPRARRIDLTFSSALIPFPDPRPGKVDPYNKQITTQVVLKADLGDVVWYVQGDVTFYLVRGDRAVIPQDLKNRGFTADPNRWYIERWVDQTDTGSGGTAQRPNVPEAAQPVTRIPARLLGYAPEIHTTWAALKRAYLQP